MFLLLIAWIIVSVIWASFWTKATGDWTSVHDERTARLEATLTRLEVRLSGAGGEDGSISETLKGIETALRVPYEYGGMPLHAIDVSDTERSCRARSTMEVVMCDHWRMQKSLDQIRELLAQYSLNAAAVLLGGSHDLIAQDLLKGTATPTTEVQFALERFAKERGQTRADP